MPHDAEEASASYPVAYQACLPWLRRAVCPHSIRFFMITNAVIGGAIPIGVESGALVISRRGDTPASLARAGSENRASPRPIGRVVWRVIMQRSVQNTAQWMVKA
jgi:hypothetical protein